MKANGMTPTPPEPSSTTPREEADTWEPVCGTCGHGGAGDAEGFYKACTDYSNTLRTWLVAYGVGAPVVLVSNAGLLAAVTRSEWTEWITALFLVGVILQVVLATLNKAAMWGCYYGAENREFRETRYYGWANWLSQQFWIDIGLDVLTIALFVTATWWAVSVVGKAGDFSIQP
jgi:hypothetical protein